MPDILANPNALPARADMQVRSDGILDLANFVAEVVPAPDSVLEAMRQLSVTRAETVYIGDSDVDVETARNAGVACCAVSWGFRSVQCLRDAGAARIAANPQELLAMLEAL